MNHEQAQFNCEELQVALEKLRINLATSLQFIERLRECESQRDLNDMSRDLESAFEYRSSGATIDTNNVMLLKSLKNFAFQDLFSDSTVDDLFELDEVIKQLHKPTLVVCTDLDESFDVDDIIDDSIDQQAAASRAPR